VVLCGLCVEIVKQQESEPSGPVDNILPEDFLLQLKQVASGSVPSLTASIPVRFNNTLF
jgi:hypothetical protein